MGRRFVAVLVWTLSAGQEPEEIDCEDDFCFGCQMLNYCNGHGRCSAGGGDPSPFVTCVCDKGWGSPDDIATEKDALCMLRTCPKGRATSDLPFSKNEAHPMRECSNNVAALERAEVSARLYDPSLIETTSTAKSRLGDHRYRPDHFKGLAREQVRDIIASNEAIIAANKLAKEEGKDADVDYDNSQAELLRLAHEDEEQHQATVRRAAMEHAEELLAMRDVEREKIRKSKEDRFGYIQGGYLDGFGTSCR